MANTKIRTLEIIILLLFLLDTSFSKQCNDLNYPIPTASWDSIFDPNPSSILENQNLVNLIANPQSVNIKDYATKVAPASAPLWILASLTVIIFLVMAIQIILFDFVGIKACGRKLNAETYNPLNVRIITGLFLVLSAITFAGSITGLIINSKLFEAIKDSTCNAENILSQLYNGNNNNSAMPWSGTNNFAPMVNQLATGLQNQVPFLSSYFSKDQNPYFQQLTNETGPLFKNAITFNCMNPSLLLTCPFSDSTICPSPLKAVFYEDFCEQSVSTSAVAMINNEIMINQTLWIVSLNAIQATLGAMKLSDESIANLTNTYNQIGDNLTNYQNYVEEAFNSAQDAIQDMLVTLYVFYCFMVILTASSFIMVVSVYFFKIFQCRYLTYVIWAFYMISGTVIFVISAVSLSIYLTQYDICSAYSYALSNQANFNTIPFPDNKIAQVLQTCYFQNGQSIFRVLSNTPLSEQLIALTDSYEEAQPNSSFNSIVSQIEQTLLTYYYNPSSVEFVDQTETSSAAYALQMANQFANYSNPQSTQQCNITQDYIVFNPANCGMFPFLANPPTPSCVPTAENVASRVQAFSNVGTTACDNQGKEYQDNFDSLQNYAVSLQNMINSLITITTNNNNPLNTYQQNYFLYWSSMLNFMNNNIMTQFNIFYEPYLTLDDGASCSFITASIDSLIQYPCNNTYRPLQAFVVINIMLGCFMLTLMIFTYFLTSRYEFYQFIEGDYTNSENLEESLRDSSVNRTLQMGNTNDQKDKQLISNRSNL